MTANSVDDAPNRGHLLGQLKDRTRSAGIVLRSEWIVVALVVLGIGVRLLVATRGHNYDFESYRIVAAIAEEGGNVYASTIRYNYGPVWYGVVHLLDRLAGGSEVGFRYLLALFLGLVDVGIFAVLWRRRGRWIAAYFFLNPISILITGYYSQFENLALLLGFLAVALLGDDVEQPLSGRKVLGLCVLGLSLMTKHILVAFPIWLAVKQKGVLRKAIVILAPVTLFVLGFVPFWREGYAGIVQNVFLYRSFANEPFYRIFIPASGQALVSSRMVWVGALLLFAFIYRQRNAFESLLVYTGVLVALSPAMASQYLAIPVPFVVSWPNLATVLYTILGTGHLLVDGEGLQIHALEIGWLAESETAFAVLVSILCAAVVWVTWRRQLVAIAQWTLREARVQLGR